MTEKQMCLAPKVILFPSPALSPMFRAPVKALTKRDTISWILHSLALCTMLTKCKVSFAAEQKNNKPVQQDQPWNANRQYTAQLFSTKRWCSTGLIMKQNYLNVSLARIRHVCKQHTFTFDTPFTCLCNLVRFTCVFMENLRDFCVDNRSIWRRSYLAHYKVGLGGEVMGSGQLTNLPCFTAPALS